MVDADNLIFCSRLRFVGCRTTFVHFVFQLVYKIFKKKLLWYSSRISVSEHVFWGFGLAIRWGSTYRPKFHRLFKQISFGFRSNWKHNFHKKTSQLDRTKSHKFKIWTNRNSQKLYWWKVATWEEIDLCFFLILWRKKSFPTKFISTPEQQTNYLDWPHSRMATFCVYILEWLHSASKIISEF